MGYIYKITNLINGKIYIGQTRFNVQRRFHQHLYEAKKGELNFPLYSAIRKYGEENFKIECIEEMLKIIKDIMQLMAEKDTL